ncbi:MAG: hypothetical protein JNK04_26045, partial [Myxococcales bacterium]|nr:hypothetical protein [Myxococcales bacterium]
MGAIEARWGSLRAVVLRLAIAAPATATAQPAAPAEAGVELTVQSPAGCPDTAAIDSMLERLLGPSKATGEKTRASITIEPVAPAGAEQGATETAELELTLVTETRSGRESRKLRSASCQTLAETAALFVAIVHDPDVDTSRVALSAPPREPTPAPPPLAPPPRLVAPERPRLPPRKPSIFGFALSAWGGMAGLDLPSLHGVFGGSLGLRLESFRLEAGGAFSAGSTVLPSDASKGADFTLP